jgi:hypothetical protein
MDSPECLGLPLKALYIYCERYSDRSQLVSTLIAMALERILSYVDLVLVL